MPETLRRSLLTDCTGDMTPRDRRNKLRYIAMLFLWMVVFIGGKYAIVRGWVDEGPLAWSTAVLPSVVAAAAVLAYVRFLRDGDELLRAIQLRALALALGAGFVAWPAYELFGSLGYDMAAWDTVPTMAMIITYTGAVLLGQRHYA